MKQARPSAAVLLVVGIAALIGLIAAGAWWFTRRGADDYARFAGYMTSGRTYYQQGDGTRAVEAFQFARAMNPANPDVHLNLANAFLLANQPGPAASHAAEAAQLEPNHGAGPYLLGCALLRQGQFSNAVQQLQQAKDADRTINAVSYQLGRAYAGLGRHQEAAEQFTEVTQFETNHPSAYYQLSQSLLRLGRREEAAAALAVHQQLAAGRPQAAADNPSLYERCAYTEIRVPQVLEQPDRQGVPVRFVDATTAAFGSESGRWRGPFGQFDLNRRGWNDLLVAEGESGWRLLWNSNGVFQAAPAPIAVPAGTNFRSVLVGDLNNDRYEDALLLGEQGTVALRFATNGFVTDVTRLSQLGGVKAPAAGLGDFEFTGRLALLAARTDGTPQLFRGLGNLAFRDITATSGIPAGVTGVTDVVVDDWNNDDLPDAVLVRRGAPPLVLANQRGGGFQAGVQPEGWPVAKAVALGDFNNDFRMDAVLVTESTLDVFFGSLKEPQRLAARKNRLESVRALDYDNDGWLDLVAWGGDGLRVWRNRGYAGFTEVTQALGLATPGAVRHVAAADFDQDGDVDLVAGTADGVRFWRNEGAQRNGLVKVRLLGNRSNASGLGVKLELSAGTWRTLRSVSRLPVEIGIGPRQHLDSLNVRWFDTQLANTDVEVNPKTVLNLIELTIPQGSCPYLYAWDGKEYRFITDLLGAAPAGLPVAKGRHIEADPEEIVRVGDASTLQPRDGAYRLQVTEELCEILYLDAARLLVVDRPAELEVLPTSRLLPGAPFPPHQLLALHQRRPLQRATTLAGDDVTAALQATDGRKVSPPALRGPHYRGLAEPHGVVLDFGPLPADRPLALALTGWLRFGGGMANIAASQIDSFPFPFPTLEAETAEGSWQPVPVAFGAPAGKTKSYVVDLTGKLPAGTRRLRLTQAFEIHWDRIALLERLPGRAGAEGPDASLPASVRVTSLLPTRTDLHHRGYSRFADLPWTEPQTPVYADLLPQANWRRTPSGWATRYGAIDELLERRDDGLAVVAGGDELTLDFAADRLPAPPPGTVREFFLWTVGWDKDADFHVAAGLTVEPLPWNGMDDQQYGRAPRPPRPTDALHDQFNTRWVGPRPLARREARSSR